MHNKLKCCSSRTLILLVLALFLLISAHLFESLGLRRANKVRLHVVNTALRVHQVLVLFTLDLDHSHDDAIYHVN